MNMESSREQFEKILKSYHEYVALYRSINHGSDEGLTTFAQFYWRFSYEVRYEDAARIAAISN